MDKFEPRLEVIEFLESLISESDYLDEKLLCAGRKTYSQKEILDEIKQGTSFGISFYHSLEQQYDERDSED